MGVIPTLVSIVAVVLAIIHVAFPHLAVDTTTVLLLGLAALLYYFPEIRKGKLPGGFEWEKVSPEEVEKIEEEVEQVVKKAKEEGIEATSITVGEVTTLEQLQDQLLMWVETDARVALARLRIELETMLRQLYYLVEPKASDIPWPPVFGEMLSGLASRNVLDLSEQAIVRAVWSVCSRAIHGEEIPVNQAKRIILMGIEMLHFLGMRREKLESYEG